MTTLPARRSGCFHFVGIEVAPTSNPLIAVGRGVEEMIMPWEQGSTLQRADRPKYGNKGDANSPGVALPSGSSGSLVETGQRPFPSSPQAWVSVKQRGPPKQTQLCLKAVRVGPQKRSQVLGQRRAGLTASEPDPKGASEAGFRGSGGIGHAGQLVPFLTRNPCICGKPLAAPSQKKRKKKRDSEEDKSKEEIMREKLHRIISWEQGEEKTRIRGQFENEVIVEAKVKSGTRHSEWRSQRLNKMADAPLFIGHREEGEWSFPPKTLEFLHSEMRKSSLSRCGYGVPVAEISIF
ncbi:Alpha-protein kinase 2 [Varanus komodoensis]|nr:Alpha-protein kinase 2 [Varanus komodoensis]